VIKRSDHKFSFLYCEEL